MTPSPEDNPQLAGEVCVKAGPPQHLSKHYREKHKSSGGYAFTVALIGLSMSVNQDIHKKTLCIE